jgi:predicted dehydrogenase
MLLVFANFKHVLGDFAKLKSIVKTQYPTIRLVDAVGNAIHTSHHKTAPDHVLVQGTLASSALASISFRTVSSTIDGVGIRWLISGTEGEIEATVLEILWQLRRPGWALKIKSGNGEAKNVEFSIPDENYPGSFIGINTARLYEAYANKETEKYADFEDGLVSLRALDSILQASK